MKACSECKTNERASNRRYCLDCHAGYMRKWRATHPLNPEQRKKDNCRSYAGVYLRRGKLQKEPCTVCGDRNSQMHHEDYDKPLNVIWLCRTHHLQLHKTHIT